VTAFRKAWPAISLAVLLLFALEVAGAAELRWVNVERDDDHYQLRSLTWFNTNSEQLYRVFTDYDQFHRFTSAIVESKNIEPDKQGRPQFYSKMEGCVLRFCMTFDRNGYLDLEDDTVTAISDPEKSDFNKSHESWTMIPTTDGTLVIYQFEMIPDFWVPPVIGPYFIQKALKSGGERAVNRIEAIALGKEPQK
jgi:hypothetical protein